VDALVRSGRYRTSVPLPFVVGRDLVGTVAAVGSEALPFAVGDPRARSVPQLAEAAALVDDLLRRGLLTTRIADMLPLARTAEAHRRIERGVRGRLLLHP
ncbi:MAG TPA: hypothetical protein VFJ12_09795, partial [Segeticoccus sp.]|nr:hypothetical protein [Segeticoccus sp.]